MIQLTCDLSTPLLGLISDGQAPIHGVEVGSWFSVRELRAYRRMLPDLPFYFHGGDLIERVGVIPGATSRIAAYVRCTGSPWVSMHLAMWLPGTVWLMLRRGWRMPLPDTRRAVRRLVRQVKRLTACSRVSVFLENVEPLPFQGYEFEVQPPLIADVLQEADCGFVLDISHARVAASALSLDVRGYLQSLPLERVQQVHVSGPRLRNGRLVDVHESLQEVDYELLDFVLARTQPQVVTLEYIRERQALREQLVRLRGMLGRKARC
jgi:uncharacterized protein (UPF0276 family)